MHTTSPLANGTILDRRYKILRELGRGGFGRTYLAEDIRRYNERCILKEFAPLVTSSSELQKARELFEREAATLYTLNHPQIPRFRELLPVSVAGGESLFLVQDYIEGESYWQILNSRLKQGRVFSESEVIQLLLQILPVLQYIHSQNVIHRDISPDNIIQRSYDKLPILIDFGSVKQVAVNAISQVTGKSFGTVVGKDGYIPEEQIRLGMVYPASDLYSLAVTVLVLLTGKAPKNLYDVANGVWRWKQEVKVSPKLEAVLDKMLAYRVRERYQEAREVLQVLQPSVTQNSYAFTQMATQIVAPGWHKITNAVSQIATRIASGGKSKPPKPQSSPSQPDNLLYWRALAQGMSVVIVPALVILAVIKSNLFSLLPNISLPSPPEISLPLPNISLPSIPFPSNPVSSHPSNSNQSEKERRIKIRQRIKDLKLDEGNFYQQVDELFYAQHPELNRRSLTNNSEDAELREKWYDIAESLLEQQQ